MTRYHRMQGKPTLWLPGADHAGFETQVVFEKKLEKEGKSRFKLTRKELYKKMWDFTQNNKLVMQDQLKSFGASCDWTRDKFTLDKDIIKIVYQTFEQLHKDGLLYRDYRPINWCTKHQTSLSELEVKYIQQEDHLYYIKYPIYKNKNLKFKIKNFLIIATTRPETIFADVAIAVNPKDKKYKQYIGQFVTIPLTNRKIPIIADENVDPAFGTGALKITPAHDPLDFEIGKKHKLKILTAINKYGKLTNLTGEFYKMKVLEAREAIIKKLNDQKYLKDTKKHTHQVGHCYKCNRIIEPRILPQWFVKTKPLAKNAIQAVKTGRVKFASNKFEKIFFHWLTNIRDWNISRQIVWGIQIPAYYCQKCNHAMIDINKKPTRCPKCNSLEIVQDEDVFDTWFSSGQWPFATLMTGKKDDFKKYYPTSVMETGWDILFFWVARMIMLGIYKTGKVPFKTVYLHGLVRDKDRQKMSKSKGNTIDPLGVAKEYGTDAVRMALIFGSGVGNDIVISKEKIKAMRNFSTKIWNASKFVMMNLKNQKTYTTNKIPNLTTQADKKIISDLHHTISEVKTHINNYRFGLAVEKIYSFFWHNFCDTYLEKSKTQLQDPKLKQNTQQILLYVLINSLKLLHPFMPFITEEIYQKLPIKNKLKSLMISPWPSDK
jgi:valyl-tRNA synthetase